MKVIHTISSLGINSGGPTTCTYYLLKGLLSRVNKLNVLTFEPEIGDKLIAYDAFIKTVNNPKEKRFGYSNDFRKELNDLLPADIIHANALWQYTSYVSFKLARKWKIPFILSPHGMLYPSALQKSKWIKTISLFLYQRKALVKASVLHATCLQEMQHIKNLGIKTPVAVIPNPVLFNHDIKLSGNSKEKFRIGFMGRFQPIKNIEYLVLAFGSLKQKYPLAELVLIGDGSPAYKASLELLAKQEGIQNIKFTGFLQGVAQVMVVDSLSVLVLPSKSENFGMVVPEALLREIPVIASKGTPWEELETYNCGWWVDTGVEPLQKALEQALALPPETLQQMGKNGRKLVEEKYSIEAVAEQMLALYKWILKQGEKPGFVYD